MPSAPPHVEPGPAQEIPGLTDAAHRVGPDAVTPGRNEITLNTSMSRAAGIVGEFAAMIAAKRSRAWAERQ